MGSTAPSDLTFFHSQLCPEQYFSEHLTIPSAPKTNSQTDDAKAKIENHLSNISSTDFEINKELEIANKEDSLINIKKLNLNKAKTQGDIAAPASSDAGRAPVTRASLNLQVSRLDSVKDRNSDCEHSHNNSSPIFNPSSTKITNIPVELPIQINSLSQYELVVEKHEVIRDRRGQWYRAPVYSTLGDGMYGRVVEVKDKDTTYAAKIIYTSDKNNPHMLSAEVLREVSLYKDLNDIHGNSFPHLPKFYGFKARHQFSEYFAEKYLHKCRRCAVLIIEKCHQSFRQFIMLNSKKLTIDWVRFYIWQLLNGLARIHSQNLSHRDLKPDNLLVSPINENKEELKDVRLLKISDLGMGRKLRNEFSIDNAGGNGLLELIDNSMVPEGKPQKKRSLFGKNEMPQTGVVVTLPYRPPELFLSDPTLRDMSGSHVAFYGKACDIWSAGVIFAELCILHNSDARYWKYMFYSRRYEGNYNGKLLMMLTNICKLLGCPHDFECEYFKKISRNNWPTLGPYLKSFPMLSEVERLHSINKFIKSHGGIELDYYGLDLLSRMLQYDPAKRLSAKDALAHPFFESLPYKKMNELGFTCWMSQLSHPTIFRYLKPFSQNQLRAWQSAGGSLKDTQLCLRIHQLPLKPLESRDSKRKCDHNKDSSPRLPFLHMKSPLGTLSIDSENRSHNLPHKEDERSQSTSENESQLSIINEVLELSQEAIFLKQNSENSSKRHKGGDEFLLG